MSTAPSTSSGRSSTSSSPRGATPRQPSGSSNGAIGTTKVAPTEVTTDQAPVYPAVLEELLPAAWHRTDRYAKQSGRVRPREAEGAAAPMHGLKQNPQRQGDHRRTRLRAEPSPRTLRAGGYRAHQPASRGRIRRTGLGD